MIVGIPKEIKNHEYRIGMTPGWRARVGQSWSSGIGRN